MQANAFFTNLLTIANIVVCLLLILTVLLQRPKSEGLGTTFGGEAASRILGVEAADVLARVTRWLGTMFLALCLAIAILGSQRAEGTNKTPEFLKNKAQEQSQNGG